MPHQWQHKRDSQNNSLFPTGFISFSKFNSCLNYTYIVVKHVIGPAKCISKCNWLNSSIIKCLPYLEQQLRLVKNGPITIHYAPPSSRHMSIIRNLLDQIYPQENVDVTQNTLRCSRKYLSYLSVAMFVGISLPTLSKCSIF